MRKSPSWEHFKEAIWRVLHPLFGAPATRKREMMSEQIDANLRGRDLEIRFWAFTVFGVSLESIVGTAMVFNLTTQILLLNPALSQIPLSNFVPSATLPLMVAYALLPLPYCWMASRSFKPKRLVSPLNIQLFSLVAATVAYITLWVMATGSTNLPNFAVFLFLEDVTSFVLFFGIVFLVIGLFETQVLKFLLGLNGTIDDIDLKAWAIDLPFEEVVKLMDDEFLEHYDLKLLRRRDNLVLLRHYYYGNDRRRVVVGLAPAKNDISRTIIAACGFGRGYYAIYRLDSASAKRDRVVKDIQYRLKELKPSLDFFDSPSPATNDLASESVRDLSLAATEAGASALARVRRSVVITFGIPISIIAILTIPWAYGKISTDFYGSVLAFYAFTLMTIYYPEIKERYSERREAARASGIA